MLRGKIKEGGRLKYYYGSEVQSYQRVRWVVRVGVGVCGAETGALWDVRNARCGRDYK